MSTTSAHDENIRAIAEYLASGIKSELVGAVGYELEHTLLRKGGMPVRFDGPDGIERVLEELAPGYDEKVYEHGRLIALARSHESVTIEPAGQLEISSGPYTSVADAAASYERFRSLLDPVLGELGLMVSSLGSNPAASAAELALVPKYRYECMNRYLGALGPHGAWMMRSSTAFQVSVDFSSERDAARKLRIANAITPLLSLIADNTPLYETEPKPFNIVRSHNWEHVDPDRCGTVPGSMDEGFTFRDYAEWVLGVPAIIVPDADAPGSWRYAGAQTFDEIYARRAMSTGELEHALSMEWPDARLKTYLEVRAADSMPPQYCWAYYSLVKGLFYSEDALARIEQELGGVTEQDIADAKHAIMLLGYNATVYGQNVALLADLLTELAREGLAEDERAWLTPLEALVASRTTLADMYEA